MGVSRSGRWARAVLAAGVVGASLLVAGCTELGAVKHPAPPVLAYFAVGQQPEDLLPPGSPALLTVIPDSTRTVGATGLYEFFFARGVFAPYCVVAVDIYDVSSGPVCGGAAFGGQLAEGVWFEFGERFARAVSQGNGYVTFNTHLTVSFADSVVDPHPLVGQILSRPQVPSDVPTIDANSGWADPESYRLLATDRGVSFYIARPPWSGGMLCVFTVDDSDDAQSWGSGSCGARDIVLYSQQGLDAHVSVAGFESDAPEGWRQVTPLLRVRELGGSSAQLFRVPAEDAEPLHP